MFLHSHISLDGAMDIVCGYLSVDMNPLMDMQAAFDQIRFNGRGSCVYFMRGVPPAAQIAEFGDTMLVHSSARSSTPISKS